MRASVLYVMDADDQMLANQVYYENKSRPHTLGEEEKPFSNLHPAKPYQIYIKL
jgi:hypothetical protein